MRKLLFSAGFGIRARASDDGGHVLLDVPSGVNDSPVTARCLAVLLTQVPWADVARSTPLADLRRLSCAHRSLLEPGRSLATGSGIFVMSPRTAVEMLATTNPHDVAGQRITCLWTGPGPYRGCFGENMGIRSRVGLLDQYLTDEDLPRVRLSLSPTLPFPDGSVVLVAHHSATVLLAR